MSYYKFIAEKLRSARVNSGYSLDYVSKELMELYSLYGINKKEIKADSIRKWETGDSTPNAKQVGMLASIYNINIEFFYIEEKSFEMSKLDEKRTQKLDLILNKVTDLEEKIMPAAEYDPLAHHVKTHKELREVVEMLTKLDERSLIEARGLIRGFMVGSGKQEREEPESTPDEREKGNLNAG